VSIVFGPINSRRFGKSLGVDLSPNIKQCNFDCLYCELKSSSKVDEYKDIVDLNLVVNEIKNALKEHKSIDVLTLTANGEPTLYPHLSELIDAINSFKSGFKTLILSNSSTIDKKEVQSALKKLDIVKLSLDCATKECFKKLDRATKSIDLEDIKRGILEFSKDFKNSLIIEILIVKGLNDKVSEIKKLNEFLKELKPTRVDISTIDRPPAYKVEPLSYKELYNLSLNFDSSLNISIASKKYSKQEAEFYSKEQILETLKRRPLTKDDVSVLFNKEAQKNLQELLEDKLIKIVSVGKVEFYKSLI